MSDNITLPREVVELALEVVELALEVVELSSGGEPIGTMEREAIEALRTALAAEQPKQEPVALRLAEELDRDAKRELFRYLDLDKAAAELRRLHAENERLREALEHMIDVYLGQVQNDGGYTVLDSVRPLIADQTALRREDKR